MGNLITPFKGAVCAAIAHALITSLPNMADAQASYVADAAWIALTTALAYVTPKDLGSGISAWILARFLKLRA